MQLVVRKYKLLILNYLAQTPTPKAQATRMSSMIIKYQKYSTIEIRINPFDTITAERKLIALVDNVEIRAATSGSSVLLQNSVPFLFDNYKQKNIRVSFMQDMLSLDCQIVSLDFSGELNCRLQILVSYKNKISGLVGNWVEGN